MHFPTSTSLAALAMSSTAVAHVVLERPKPFKFPNYGPTNPLNTDGSDFPCKKLPGQPLEMDGAPTVMALGENQTLSFSGQAVHGGGSCQISLTADLQPTKESRWTVIHSIEGGCPARNQKGNLEEGAANQDEYQFVVPEGAFAAGEYVLSWTWNNRISGSAEFYQNCAPVTVVDRKSKRRGAAARREVAAKRAEAAAELPEMFMANLGDLTGGCSTNEAVLQQLAIAYPNPGPSVERPEGDAALFQQTCDGNPNAGKGGGAVPAPKPPVASSSSSAAAPPEPTSTTMAPPPPGTTVTTPIVVVTPSPSAAPTDDASAQPPPTPTATSEVDPVPTGGAECAVEGHLTCMEDGLSFKTCTGGQLRPDGDAVPVPPGYKCTPGSGEGLDLQLIE